MDTGSPYFLLLSIGMALGCHWALRWAPRLGIARLALIDVCIAAVVGGIVGSRVLHVVAEPLPGHALTSHELDDLRARLPELDPAGRALLEEALASAPVAAPWSFVARVPPGPVRDEMVAAIRRDPTQVPAWLWYRAHPGYALQFWRGGLAYIGGLALAVALCLTVAWRHGQDLRDVADLTSPAIALGLVFGRIGCFLGGCCYGAVCPPAWWAHQPSWYGPPVGGVPRYPTALLSSAAALAVFLALRLLIQRRRFHGEVFLALLVLYAPGRFLIESLRADPRGGALGLSTSQLGVLVTGLPALVLWIAGRTRSRGALPLLEGEDRAADQAGLAATETVTEA
ncbi:MAG: prolipoprotein diacylglyceryl transferase [Planctomycetota bacterium]